MLKNTHNSFLLPLRFNFIFMQKLSLDSLQRIDADTYKKSNKAPIIVVLDNIRSMQNIGSVFRSADAFRIEAIYLCGITATPPHRDIQKTALGATETVEWIYFPSTREAITALKNKNVVICSIEQVEHSTYLHHFTPEKTKKYALILGNEVDGVAQDIIDQSDYCLEIPQYGTKHSLNIAVATGIVLWDFTAKLPEMDTY